MDLIRDSVVSVVKWLLREQLVTVVDVASESAAGSANSLVLLRGGV